MPTAARSQRAKPPIRPRRAGKARRGRPGSQETCLRPKAHKPSWKGVGSMHLSRRISLALGAALHLICPVRRASAAIAAGTDHRHGPGGGIQRSTLAAADAGHDHHDAGSGRRRRSAAGRALAVRSTTRRTVTGTRRKQVRGVRNPRHRSRARPSPLRRRRLCLLVNLAEQRIRAEREPAANRPVRTWTSCSPHSASRSGPNAHQRNRAGPLPAP